MHVRDRMALLACVVNRVLQLTFSCTLAYFGEPVLTDVAVALDLRTFCPLMWIE